MTRLGYTKRETEHAYFGEIMDKIELYKAYTKREAKKLYGANNEPDHFDSLRDF